MWPLNLTDGLEKQRAPLLCHIKLCESFRCHWWIQTGVTVRNRPIWVKFDDFESRVTFKFDGWLWKSMGHLSHATSTFVHHSVAIGEFKLELQSGNSQFGSNSTILLTVLHSNLTDDLEKTIGHLFYDTLSYVHYFYTIAKFKLKLQTRNDQFGSKSTIF